MNSTQFSPRIQDTHLGRSLPDLLTERAAVQPDAIAVSFDDQDLSYQGLEQASRRLACYLHRQGVGADDCVGLYVEPSLDLMVGAWGILHAGAAYLPLSPEYPEERLRYMLEDSRTRVVVTHDHLVSRLTELAPREPGSSPWPTRTPASRAAVTR